MNRGEKMGHQFNNLIQVRIDWCKQQFNQLRYGAFSTYCAERRTFGLFRPTSPNRGQM